MNMPMPTANPQSSNHGHTAVLCENSATKNWLAGPSGTRTNGQTVGCSIVVPMLNESGTVSDFRQRVAKVMNELGGLVRGHSGGRREHRPDLRDDAGAKLHCLAAARRYARI